MSVDGAQVADVERGGVAAQSAVFQPLFIALYRCPIDFLQWHIASFQVTLEAVEGGFVPCYHPLLADASQFFVQLQRIADNAM